MPKSRSRRKPTSRPAARSGSKPPLVKQPAPGLRGGVERASAPLLVRLTSMPKLTLPVLSVALLLGGLFSPPAVGVPLLLLLALVVGWLSYLSWPVVAGVQRLVRVATIGLLLAAIAGKLAA